MRPQTIVERLDFVAKRIQGLKFTPPTQLKPGDDQFYGCFMSCDMYYIEIKVDQSHQSVKDVIISHGNSAEGISCPVLRKVLADQDFETFAKHLSGLHSIYQINTNDKKVKQRAYPALTALETDLTILYEHQRRRVGSCHDLVHKSPIGHMEPRRGGLPVKLTFFITPYDLVDTTSKTFITLNMNNISEKNLGLSATVEIEGSSPHKLQIKSLITQHNSSLPLYPPFNSQNSEKLPAQFVLVLSQRFPMLNTSIKQIINEINEPATIKEYLSSVMTRSRESIVNLIAREELELNKGPFCRPVDGLNRADSELCDLAKHVYSVILPDQNHTYHISDNYLERPEGVYVEKIPFTHPTSIPSIIKVLRQQALFNFLIGSCIRRNRNTNNTSSSTDENATKVTNVFDVLPVSLTNVCVSFEYPSKESLATLEIDLKDISCQLYALNKESVCSNEFATKVLQKCWSIPVALRSVLKKCNERRLALLEDSNKRRERELQELLANNSSTQQGLQIKPNHTKHQETSMQSKLPNERAPPRDLNSIAEFLTSKATNANANANAISNTNVSAIDISVDANSEMSNRTNLLKKFSCKPKAKQPTTTKSQSGNKILSLMLKRQNSTPSVEDPLHKGPSTKKIKTKNSSFESSSGDVSMTPSLTTTKLISPSEVVATATKTIIKPPKQGGNNVSVSLSLNRSPSKSQTSTISSSTNSSSQAGLSVGSSSKHPEAQSGVRVKLQGASGNGGLANSQKPRKSSIGAVLDRLVGNVTPEQQNLMNQLNSTDANADRAADSSRVLPNGAKSKSRPPGGDQFAIKQGSSGGGLKLTVTKTKPASLGSISSSISNNLTTASTQSSHGISNSSSASTTSTTASTSTSATSSNASSTNSNQSSKQAEDKPSTKTTDHSSSSTPSIRYTIPKISKTQQASQSSNQSSALSSDRSSNQSTTDPANQQTDDSNNPSSSGNSSAAAPSSTTAKRTTSNPFNRNISSNRNPVSSSTHPPNRTTSNPLANALSRPTSTSSVNNHVMNRISSSSNNNQTSIGLNQQPVMSRSVNLMPQPILQGQGHVQPQPPAQSLVNTPQHFNVAQRFLSAGLLQQPTSASLPMIGQPLPPQMFSLRLPQQSSIFANPNDLNLIAASQVALLNQQQQMQQQQQQQPQQQQQKGPLTSQQVSSIFPVILPSSQDNQQPQQQQASVTSSSDNGNPSQDTKSSASALEQATSSSTPSSPTECSQVETVAPPPLIPIDSLHERRPASPDDIRDDESDRLSIVDMNESVAADGNSSVAGTPKPSDVGSPPEIPLDSTIASSSATGTVMAKSVAVTKASSTPSSSAPTTSSMMETNRDLNDVVMSEPETHVGPSASPNQLPPSSSSTTTDQPLVSQQIADSNPSNVISPNTAQSPQSSVAATTTNSD